MDNPQEIFSGGALRRARHEHVDMDALECGINQTYIGLVQLSLHL